MESNQKFRGGVDNAVVLRAARSRDRGEHPLPVLGLVALSERLLPSNLVDLRVIVIYCTLKQHARRVAAAMRHLKRILDVYVVLQSAFVLSCCSVESEPGPGAGNGDRFKIEGRAIVSGVKAQDWVSSARVLVEGGEYIGFLR